VATILIPTPLRAYSHGRDHVDVAGGGSLRQVIDKLEAECPGIKAQLIEDGDIRAGIAIAIDDELTASGLLERVPEDGSVNILPAIGGGSLHDGILRKRLTRTPEVQVNHSPRGHSALCFWPRYAPFQHPTSNL
jgi:hypothetical protein